jgi:predicted transcriptional regulator
VFVGGHAGERGITSDPLAADCNRNYAERRSNAIVMHVHAWHLWYMRTTIEIPDTQRARLLDLAARRGEKGFSRLVQQAVERMLAEDDSRRSRIKAALAREGSMSEKAADELTASVARMRSTWR